MALSGTRPSQYKSSHYEVKRSLIRSRDRQRQRAERLQQQVEALKAENQRLRQDLQQAAEELEMVRTLQPFEDAVSPLDSLATRLSEFHIAGHHYSATMIALCINLARDVGFRQAETSLKALVAALGLPIKVPSHDVMRNWCSRLGVSELRNPFREDQDVLWMADHSSQIGKEKVLLIIGIALEDLPQPGETLALEDMHVLAIIPGKQWKKEDVGREYQKLAAKIGAPRYLLCDGATELQDPAKELEKNGKKTVVLTDLKHHAANVLEKLIGRSERFKTFLSEVGLTRNRVQQTELSVFVPPPLKVKSRFMNLAGLLRWAGLASYYLDQPQSEIRAGISDERMNEKLGWLREYGEDLICWTACQLLINAALRFINHQGLFHGAAAQLRQELAQVMRYLPKANEAVNFMRDALVDFVTQSEQKLEAGQRVWLSTEILESLFGQYKRLESQHSKGGFTSLLAALPIFCCRVTPALVQRRLQEVSTTDLNEWVQTTVGPTLTSRRTRAYREYDRAMAGQVSQAI